MMNIKPIPFDKNKTNNLEKEFTAYCRFPNPFNPSEICTGMAKYSPFNHRWYVIFKGKPMELEVDLYIPESDLLNWEYKGE